MVTYSHYATRRAGRADTASVTVVAAANLSSNFLKVVTFQNWGKGGGTKKQLKKMYIRDEKDGVCGILLCL